MKIFLIGSSYLFFYIYLRVHQMESFLIQLFFYLDKK